MGHPAVWIGQPDGHGTVESYTAIKALQPFTAHFYSSP